MTDDAYIGQPSANFNRISGHTKMSEERQRKQGRDVIVPGYKACRKTHYGPESHPHPTLPGLCGVQHAHSKCDGINIVPRAEKPCNTQEGPPVAFSTFVNDGRGAVVMMIVPGKSLSELQQAAPHDCLQTCTKCGTSV